MEKAVRKPSAPSDVVAGQLVSGSARRSDTTRAGPSGARRWRSVFSILTPLYVALGFQKFDERTGREMEEWSEERLRLLAIVSDCIDELESMLERTSGSCAELIADTVERLEQGLEIILRELAHPFIGRDSVPPSRVLH